MCKVGTCMIDPMIKCVEGTDATTSPGKLQTRQSVTVVQLNIIQRRGLQWAEIKAPCCLHLWPSIPWCSCLMSMVDVWHGCKRRQTPTLAPTTSTTITYPVYSNIHCTLSSRHSLHPLLPFYHLQCLNYTLYLCCWCINTHSRCCPMNSTQANHIDIHPIYLMTIHLFHIIFSPSLSCPLHLS